MRIVIPVSLSDIDRLPWLTDVLIHLQGLQAHDILIFPTPMAEARAHTEADRLRAVCPLVNVQAMPFEPDWGWPISPNLQWHAAVTYLQSIKHFAGWFWMEVDCVPRVRDWASLLANEYLNKGKPFCGHIVPTPFRSAAGDIMPTPMGDTMMMGCGIYPPGIPRDIEISPLFIDIGKTPPFHAEQPWDIYLRWPMKKRGMAHTDLLADMWNTCNYRMEDDRLVCDPMPVAEKLRGRAVGGVVPEQAVLIHGCKDRSLYDLVMGKSAAVVASKVESGPLGNEGPIGHQDEPGPTGPPHPMTTVEAMLAKGSVRLGDAAKACGMTQPQLRELLAPLGYEAKPPAGWIKRTKALV